jgi:hypothetical protein
MNHCPHGSGDSAERAIAGATSVLLWSGPRGHPRARQLKPVPARGDFLRGQGESPLRRACRSICNPGQTQPSINGHKSGHNDQFLTIPEDEGRRPGTRNPGPLVKQRIESPEPSSRRRGREIPGSNEGKSRATTWKNMVGRDGIEPPTPGFSVRLGTLNRQLHPRSYVVIRRVTATSPSAHNRWRRVVPNGTVQVWGKSPVRVTRGLTGAQWRPRALMRLEICSVRRTFSSSCSA